MSKEPRYAAILQGQLRIPDIRESVEAFGVGHWRHHCHVCNGEGTIRSFLWWRFPCHPCRRTGFVQLGNPQALAARILDALVVVESALDGAKVVDTVMRDHRIATNDLDAALRSVSPSRSPDRRRSTIKAAS